MSTFASAARRAAFVLIVGRRDCENHPTQAGQRSFGSTLDDLPNVMGHTESSLCRPGSHVSILKVPQQTLPASYQLQEATVENYTRLDWARRQAANNTHKRLQIWSVFILDSILASLHASVRYTR